MGLLNLLKGWFGQGRRYRARKVEKLLGPWAPYGGKLVVRGTRLPQVVTLPEEIRKVQGVPGEHPLNEALFPYWLRLDPRLAAFVAMKVARGEFYRRREIPREGKAPRVLHAPEPLLKFMQRRILERVLTQVPVHEAAHGFVAGRSIFSNAAPHVGQRVVVTLDLRDFFPTIAFKRVWGIYKGLGFSPANAKLLAMLCCHEGKLPQGAPTSPALSNLVCRRLDSRLAALMRKHGHAYTRYADDLTFSGDEPVLRLLPLVKRIVAEEGFELAPEKTAIERSGSRQKVTGLTVNSKVAVPRKVRRLIRAMAHAQSQSPEPSGELVEFLLGHANFMKPAHPGESERLRRQLEPLRD